MLLVYNYIYLCNYSSIVIFIFYFLNFVIYCLIMYYLFINLFIFLLFTY